MDDKDALRNARDFYIQQYRTKADELRAVAQKIYSLDQDIGDATDLSAISGMEVPSIAQPQSGQNGPATASAGKVRVRPDEFVGMTYIEAAKQHLTKVGHAISTDELLEVLKSGGCVVGGVNPKKTLYISLVRGREFVPIPGQSGFLGLRSFYDKKGKSK
jgi:hypothetical protein